MSAEGKLKRIYLRAPLRTTLLFAQAGDVFKAKARNVSEGGVLIEELPFIPEQGDVPLLLDVPQMGEIKNTSSERLLLWWKRKMPIGQCFERKIIRTTVQILRTFEGQSEVDMIFVKKIGCRFVKIDAEAKECIARYISNTTRNLIYLLSLFEKIGGEQQALDYLRSVAYALGYDSEEKISVLRQSVLHDYQSLESL